jgi:hypothetical protein
MMCESWVPGLTPRRLGAVNIHAQLMVAVTCPWLSSWLAGWLAAVWLTDCVTVVAWQASAVEACDDILRHPLPAGATPEEVVVQCAAGYHAVNTALLLVR